MFLVYLFQKNYPDTNVFSSELMALDSGNYQRFLHFTQAQFFNTGQYFCDYIYNETSTPPLFPYCEGEPPTVETSVFRASVKVFVSGTVFNQLIYLAILNDHLGYSHTLICKSRWFLKHASYKLSTFHSLIISWDYVSYNFTLLTKLLIIVKHYI